jgi:hypothetical protein
MQKEKRNDKAYIMASIEEKIKQVRKLREDLGEIFIETVKSNEEFVLNLNRSALEAGKNVANQTIGMYAASTIAKKRRKGQQTQYVNLKDTGGFHDSRLIKYHKENKFSIESSDNTKFGYIKKMYPSPNVLGLTPEGKAELGVKLLTGIIKRMKKILNG